MLDNLTNEEFQKSRSKEVARERLSEKPFNEMLDLLCNQDFQTVKTFVINLILDDELYLNKKGDFIL